MSEEKEVEKIMLDAVFTVSDARNLSFPHLRENIDKMQDLFKSLESRLKEAEEKNKEIEDERFDFYATPPSERKPLLERIKELEQRLSQAEAELHRHTHGEAAPLEMVRLRQRLSHLMDVAGKLRDGLVEVLAGREGNCTCESETDCCELYRAKLALAEWDELEKK